jgi:DNA primase
MARIPDEALERLKREVSLVRLIEGQGVKLISQGKDLACRCPWHEGDDTPSCIVSPTTNLWHCFGCDAGGSVIDWVMRMHRVSFRHACELLAKQHPALAATPSANAVPSATVKLSAGKLRTAQSFSLAAGDQELLDQVIDFYHTTLKTSPEALEYLERRGLGNPDLIEHFRLGYANRTLAYRMAPKQYKAGAEMRTALQRVGILRDSGHEHFNGSIVVPLFGGERSDLAVRPVVGAYARKLLDNLRAGTPKHLYLPGPHRGVFNREGLEGQPEIILCEALIDAMTFWAAGYRNVTSCFGVNGMTEELLGALKSCGAQRILIAFDRDEAGDRGAQALSQRLTAEGLDCFQLLFPKGMDANEYALKVTPAPKSLGLVIRKAQWLGKGEAPPRIIPSNGVSTAAVESEEATKKEILAPAVIVPAAVTAPLPKPAVADTVPASIAALPEAVLPASPVPAMASGIEAQVRDEEIVIRLGDRRYRVRGLAKNLAFDVLMKVNVLIDRGESFYVDTLDLYSVRARNGFMAQAARELSVTEEVIRNDLGKVLRKLEELQEQSVAETLQPSVKPAMPAEESREAMDLLKDPNLLDRILADFTRCGVVGEESNKLIGYLAATSRKLDAPLAVMVQSSSAAGKSSLMEAVLAFMPEEDKVQYSAMTGQSLFYMGAMDLKHKILALAEEAGAARASYALKLLQSEGALSIASTGKDPETGKLVTQEYRVEGPVMIFSTTTAIDHDEELLNRCLTLGVDESREQTRAIMTLQRRKRTLEGLLAKRQKTRLIKIHQNAQRLLRPLAVRNPYADALTFPDERTRLRRDHEKYLTLIDILAPLHQHQREIKSVGEEGERVEYVEVTLGDIERANTLAHEALGRSLDELSPQTRRLLGEVTAMVERQCRAQAITRTDYRFSRREVRESTGWSDFQVKMHMHKLEELEYVLVHRGGRGQSFVYELLYDGRGQDGKPFLMGLVDVSTLQRVYDGKKEHRQPDLEHPRCAQVAGLEADSSGSISAPNAVNQSTSRETPKKNGKLTSLDEAALIPSYPHPPLAAAGLR